MTVRTISILSDSPILIQGFCRSLFSKWASDSIDLHFYFPSSSFRDTARADFQSLGQVHEIPNWKSDRFIHTQKRIRRGLSKQFLRHTPDLLLSFGEQSNQMASVISRRRSLPWIVNLCGREGFPSFSGIKGRMAAKQLRKRHLHAHQIVCFNRDDAQFLRKHDLVNPDLLRVIPGAGIDCDAIEISEASSSGFIRFVMAGRLCPEKGVREYAEAAKRLRTRFPDAVFQLQGPFEKMKGSDQEILNRWDASGALQYLSQETDYRTAIRKADIFVFPSYNGEGMPDSLLEALAQGKPLITTDHPGCKDTIDIGLNGELVPIKDVDALAKAMEHLIQVGSAARKKMGVYSRQKAQETFSTQSVIESYQAILERIPGKASAKAVKNAGVTRSSSHHLQPQLQV